MTDNLVKKALAAVCPENHGCLPVVCVCSYVEDMADRIEKLQVRLAGVDAGTHVIVPVEPTSSMNINGFAAFRDLLSEAGPYPRTKAVWRAMIRAAQEKGD